MTIHSTTDIAAPPEKVWGLISDVRHWPQLLPHTVTAVTPLEPDRPEEVGAGYVVEQPKLRTATWEITEWAPPRQFAWRSHLPGVTTTGTHVVEAQGNGSRATLSIDFAGPLAAPVRLLYGRLTQGYVDIEGGNLNERAEVS